MFGGNKAAGGRHLCIVMFPLMPIHLVNVDNMIQYNQIKFRIIVRRQSPQDPVP